MKKIVLSILALVTLGGLVNVIRRVLVTRMTEA